MKPLFVSMLLAGMATLWLSAPAQARPHDPGINARQHQQQRIGQGVRSGDLTRSEVRRLEGEQRHIRREERRYLSDGHLSRAERADLRHDQNRASRHIYDEKHDGQQRQGWQNSVRRDPGVNARQHNQRDRMRDGIRDGSLTRQETQDLRGEQKAIRAEERQYKSDGVLTRNERQDLRQDQRVASQHIYQERHDAEQRF
ncbi:MAG: hypothetical protein IPG33_05120 [Betaproteobacteria bacterium]|nr:hypothetical protein [Betaproteobacteria bacterium]